MKLIYWLIAIAALFILTTYFVNVNPEKTKSYDFLQGKESEGESHCRQILETMFGKKFNRIRPGWLRWETGKNLEVDCYNDEIPLGLEFNGKQHYEYVPHMHGSHENFLKSKARDKWKVEMFRDRKIPLVIVPYWVKPKNRENFIRKRYNCECKKYKITSETSYFANSVLVLAKEYLLNKGMVHIV